jgi:hypothetical protein
MFGRIRQVKRLQRCVDGPRALSDYQNFSPIASARRLSFPRFSTLAFLDDGAHSVWSGVVVVSAVLSNQQNKEAAMPNKLPVRVKPLGEYTQAECSTAGATTAGDNIPRLGATLPNTRMEPLSQGLIARTLDGLQFPHDPTGTGERLSRFDDLLDRIGSRVRVVYTVEDADIFHILAGVGLRVPAAKVPEALCACSSYWAHFSFGRVGLAFHEGTDEASLYFDSQILLLGGTSEQFLASFIISNVGNAIAFFLHAWEQGLYTASKPTRRRKRAPSGGKQQVRRGRPPTTRVEGGGAIERIE